MKRSGRRGFTLAEVLVVLAIIAIMAAVLMPVLTNQLRRGDVGRVIGDLGTLRTGIETFMADVRRIPGDLTHLTTPITAQDASSTDIHGQQYPAGLAARWRGPYIDQQPTELDGRFATGFGGRIRTALDTIVTGGIAWAVIEIEDLTTAEFEEIDLEIDSERSSSTGRFRLFGTIARYLAVPVS
jgi:prepilin-type N-terminal cleavage/methylation domain-containing protein